MPFFVYYLKWYIFYALQLWHHHFIEDNICSHAPTQCSVCVCVCVWRFNALGVRRAGDEP